MAKKTKVIKKKDEETVSISFAISNFRVNEWREKNVANLEIKKENISYTNSPELSFNFNGQEIFVNFKIRGFNNQTDEELFFLDASMSFHFEGGFETVINKSPDINSITIHPQIASTLISITYSTIRGVHFERSKGTIFGSYILPVVNPNVFLKNKPENIQNK